MGPETQRQANVRQLLHATNHALTSFLSFLKEDKVPIRDLYNSENTRICQDGNMSICLHKLTCNTVSFFVLKDIL